jgi:hypothetical protein
MTGDSCPFRLDSAERMGLLLEEENHEPKNALGLELGDTESTLSFDTSTDTDDLDSTPLSRSLPCLIVHHPFEAIITAIALGWTLELFWTYPFPTTIPLFVGLSTATVGFTLLAWVRLLNALRTANWRFPPGSNLWQAIRHPGTITPPSSPSSRTRCVPRRVALVASTCLMLYWCHLGLTPPAQPLPVLNRADPDVQERYFIAANLYNNEQVFKSWSTELIKLCEHCESPLLLHSRT